MPTRFPGYTPSPRVFGCPPGEEESIGLISDLVFDDGRFEFALGEPIPMTLTLINCSDQQTHLFYKDGQRYEFMAEDAEGREVWHWSHGRAFTQAVGQETIEPGQTVVYAEIWDGRDDEGQPVEPGRYKIFGFSIGCAEESATATGCQFGVGLSLDITP